MVKPSSDEIVISEREFLHDMANLILVAHGMSTLVHRSISDGKQVEEKDIERLGRSVDAINKMTALLKTRRAYLQSFEE